MTTITLSDADVQTLLIALDHLIPTAMRDDAVTLIARIKNAHADRDPADDE